MRQTLATTLVALTAVSTLLLTACGGGDGTAASPDTSGGGGGAVTNGLTLTNATDTALNRSWTFAQSGYYPPTGGRPTFAFNNNSGEADQKQQLEYEIDVDTSNQVTRAAVWHYPTATDVVFYACDNSHTNAQYHCNGKVTVDAAAKTGSFDGATLWKIDSGSLFLDPAAVVYGTGTVTVTGNVL
jgi:hypothetical protein